MSAKVKICGMREPENILAVGSLHPDFMGFIFYSGSPRCVPVDFKIPVGLPVSIKKVGVFVNETLDRILTTVRMHGLDLVQLHGDEPAMLCKELKQKGVGVIKVFSVDEGFDFTSLDPYKKTVDFFLFDTKGKYYGGNATAFDWDVLNQYDQEVPFFLSGGISTNNIHETSRLSKMNLYAVDVNSGAEDTPGVKDVEKVKELIKSIV